MAIFGINWALLVQSVEPFLYLAIKRVVAMNQKPPEQKQLTLDEVALLYAGIHRDWCNGSVDEAKAMELDNSEKAQGYLNQLKSMVDRVELEPCRREKTRIKNAGFFDVFMAEDRKPYYSDAEKDTQYLGADTVEEIKSQVLATQAVTERENDFLIIHILLKIIKIQGKGKYKEHGAQDAIAKDIELIATNDLLSSTGLSSKTINKKLKAAKEIYKGRKK